MTDNGDEISDGSDGDTSDLRGPSVSDGQPLRGPSVSDGQPLRGPDMAREALEAARARNAAARNGRRRRTGVGSAGGADSGDVMRLRRRRWSGPGADKARDPQLFGDIARSWVVKADAGGDIVKARLFAEWREIVGADIAAHARPVALVDKELSVQAESTAWATQLRLLAPGMVKKINEALGHGTVLRIRAKGPTAPSWRFGNRHVSGRGPRDTYG
ncbi:MAG: DciA family protein [Nakamurella sp.]